MKVSQAEKQRTRRRLVEAAAQVISAQGFREATMRQIAERARVGEATIYKYFPTKEDLLFGFFELRLDDLIERLKAVPDFAQYRLQEQLHLLFETQLELFTDDREFIRIAYRGVFLSNWLGAAAGSRATKARFLEIIDDLVGAAVEVGEFDEPPFKKLFYELLWEYAVGVTYYWLEDTSPNYVNTTQMLDKSLAVADAMLRSNVMGRAIELLHFLLREHVLTRLQDAAPKSSSSDNSRRPKRAFLAGPAPERAKAKKR